MKFCQPHWDALRTAIEARGIGDLIAPDAETAMKQFVDQLDKDGGVTPVNYDPLMNAHWAIFNNVADAGGPGPLMHMMSGDICPLCLANEEHKSACTDPECTYTFDDWIDAAADEQLARVEKMRTEAGG